MKTAPQAARQEKQSRMERLKELSERALKLGEGELKERVAVPHPAGGYKMVVRKVKP